jgi:hypothetical protein
MGPPFEALGSKCLDLVFFLNIFLLTDLKGGLRQLTCLLQL